MGIALALAFFAGLLGFTLLDWALCRWERITYQREYARRAHDRQVSLEESWSEAIDLLDKEESPLPWETPLPPEAPCICHDESLSLEQRTQCQAPGARGFWIMDDGIAVLHARPKPEPAVATSTAESADQRSTDSTSEDEDNYW